MINKNIPTGEVEIEVQELKSLTRLKQHHLKLMMIKKYLKKLD